MSKELDHESGRFRDARTSLLSFKNDVKHGTPIPGFLYSDALCFEIEAGTPPKVRLYLNPRYSSTNEIVSLIARYICVTPRHGVASFKVWGPRAIGRRADGIVVFCSSVNGAKALGAKLLQSPALFNAAVPAMTTRLHPSCGVAIGAEPERQATGMDCSKGADSESARSFGSIRCELIAMAIENYLVNKDVLTC